MQKIKKHTTANHPSTANIGNDVPKQDGDATDSMEEQLASIQALHDNPAKMAKDSAGTAHPGGIHTAEALGRHLNGK
jgi:hypothetical protein